MTAATRERKLVFIHGFGSHNFEALLRDVVRTEGYAFFTDEQVDKLTDRLVRYERRRVHRNIDALKDRAALEEVA